MAIKLVNRTSRDDFIGFIRTATESEAWAAISDASFFVMHARVSKAQRTELNRTIDQALAAYRQTFGQPWAPF